MIPETGTRNELKHAWFTARLLPVPGEVYECRHFVGGDQEYLRVTAVVPSKRADQTAICCETFHRVPEADIFVQQKEITTMTFDDWRFMIEGDFMYYYGCNVPGLPRRMPRFQ